MRFIIRAKPELTTTQRIEVLKVLRTLWMSPSLGYAVATLDAGANAALLEGFRTERVPDVCGRLETYGIRPSVSTITIPHHQGETHVRG